MKQTLVEVHDLLADLRKQGKDLSKDELTELLKQLVQVSTAFTNFVHAPHPEEVHDQVRTIHENVYHQIGNLLAAGQSVVRLYHRTDLASVIKETTDRLSKRIGYLLHTDFDFAHNNFEVARIYNETPNVWFEEVAQKLLAYKEDGLSFDLGKKTTENGIPYTVCAHPGIIALVLQELIINAEKAFMDSDHPPISISLVQEGENLVFRVQDVGRGMSEKEQETMFDKGISQTSSSGMGLWQVKRLAAEFGVSVFCESSALDTGTSMQVIVPLHTA